MKKLICIYTCIKDQPRLKKLKETDWYRQVTTDDECTVIEVYADPSISEEYIYTEGENVLIVRAEEVYNKLSIKTYSMIKACVSLMEFDYLVKVDATLIDYIHPHPDMNFNYFKEMYNKPEFCQEYNGIVLWEGVSAASHYAWTQRKRIPNINLNTLYELMGKEYISFYSGKCYVIDNNVCKYIAKHGETTAYVFAQHIGGNEDLMVNKLYKSYKASKD